MCFKCKKEITQTEIFRSSTCSFCGADLHACVNCKFYSPGSHYDCHESIDELVKDKERANFCDYFKITNSFAQSTNQDNSKQKAKDAFNALFN